MREKGKSKKRDREREGGGKGKRKGEGKEREGGGREGGERETDRQIEIETVREREIGREGKKREERGGNDQLQHYPLRNAKKRCHDI